MGHLLDGMGLGKVKGQEYVDRLQRELDEMDYNITEDIGDLTPIKVEEDEGDFVLDDDEELSDELLDDDDDILIDEDDKITLINDEDELIEESTTIELDEVSRLPRSLVVMRYKPDAFTGKGGVQLWFPNNQGNLDRITLEMKALTHLLSGKPFGGQSDGYMRMGTHKIKLIKGSACGRHAATRYTAQWNSFFHELNGYRGLKVPLMAEGREFRLLDLCIISSRKSKIRGLLVPSQSLSEGDVNEREALCHMNGMPMTYDLQVYTNGLVAERF